VDPGNPAWQIEAATSNIDVRLTVAKFSQETATDSDPLRSLDVSTMQVMGIPVSSHSF